MSESRKIAIGDKQFDGRDEPFETVREEWNEYKLADGRRVRAKLVIQRITQALDENGNVLCNEEGDPIIVAKHAIHILSAKS